MVGGLVPFLSCIGRQRRVVVKLSISTVWRCTPGLWKACFAIQSQIARYLLKWRKTFFLKAFFLSFFLCPSSLQEVIEGWFGWFIAFKSFIIGNNSFLNKKVHSNQNQPWISQISAALDAMLFHVHIKYEIIPLCDYLYSAATAWATLTNEKCQEKQCDVC